MKVLEKGRPQKGWSIEAKCTGAGNEGGGCGAKLLVEQADVYRTESHARDETTAYCTFQCPECRVLTDLDDKKVPSHVRQSMSYRGPNAWPSPEELRRPRAPDPDPEPPSNPMHAIGHGRGDDYAPRRR